jgi:hypothetical protein
LLAYGTWTGLIAAGDARDPRDPLDGVVGGVLFAVQTMPSLILAAVAAVAAILAARVQVLGFVADVAIGIAALATLSFGVLIALVAFPIAIPFLAVGLGLILTLAMSHWPGRPSDRGGRAAIGYLSGGRDASSRIGSDVADGTAVDVDL